MAARSNALGELTRFWLQARHGCLIDESVAVRVPPTATPTSTWSLCGLMACPGAS